MQRLKLAGAILGISATGAVTPFILPSNTQSEKDSRSASSVEGQMQSIADGELGSLVDADQDAARSAKFQAQVSLSDDFPPAPNVDALSQGVPSVVSSPISPPSNLPPISASSANVGDPGLTLPSEFPGNTGTNAGISSEASSRSAPSFDPSSGTSRSGEIPVGALPVGESQQIPNLPQSFSSPSNAGAIAGSPSLGASSPPPRNAPPYRASGPQPASLYGTTGNTANVMTSESPTGIPSQPVSRLPSNVSQGFGSTPSQSPASYPSSSPGPRQVPGQLAGYQQGANTSNANGAGLRAIDGRSRSNQAGVYPSPSVESPAAKKPSKGRYATRPYNHALFQTAAFQRGEKQSGNLSAYSPAAGGQLVSGSQTLSQRPQTPVLPAEQQFVGPSTINPGGLPQFVTPANSPVVSPPPASRAINSVPSQASQVPGPGKVPGTAIPPTYTPDYAPNLYPPNQAGAAPLITLGQDQHNVVMGRGIVGQPTVYVPGQPVRNFMRYIFP